LLFYYQAQTFNLRPTQQSASDRYIFVFIQVGISDSRLLFANTTELLTEVHRSRGQLYVQRADGSWCNDFEIKLESFVAGSQQVALNVSNKSVAPFELLGPNPVDLNDAQGKWQSYRVCSTSYQISPDMLVFDFKMDAIQQQREAKFIVPASAR